VKTTNILGNLYTEGVNNPGKSCQGWCKYPSTNMLPVKGYDIIPFTTGQYDRWPGKYLVCCGRSTTWQLGRPVARSWRTTAGQPAARTTWTAWLICSAHDHRPPSFTAALSRGVQIPPRSHRRLLIIRATVTRAPHPSYRHRVRRAHRLDRDRCR